jgi:hypothetical protein
MNIPETAYEHHFKVPVYRDSDILLRYEEHIYGTFIHCDVTKWSPQVKRKLLRVLDVLFSFHGGPVYALHDSNDRKHEKFLKLCGFRQLKSLPNDKEIWIWSNYG